VASERDQDGAVSTRRLYIAGCWSGWLPTIGPLLHPPAFAGRKGAVPE